MFQPPESLHILLFTKFDYFSLFLLRGLCQIHSYFQRASGDYIHLIFLKRLPINFCMI